MLELYQAEWCPHSRKVRQRLTELQVDFVARQVEAEPEQRAAMRAAIGATEIPVLVREDSTPLHGDDDILCWLDGAYAAGAEAGRHRVQALEKSGLPD
jgi:glutathione S-transferase